MEELQLRLSNGANGLAPEMQKLEAELEAKYGIQLKQAKHEANGRQAAQHEADKNRSIAELMKLFPLSKPAKFVVLKRDVHSWLTLAAKDMGLTWYEIKNPGVLSLDLDCAYY